MRILWSSETAHEMLNRLGQAQQGMEECTMQSAAARQALDDANVEGDDKALIKAKERFEACVRQLNALADSLEDFVNAVRRTDDMFDDAEASIGRLAGDAEEAGSGLVGTIRDYGRYANWGPDAFATMPGMRLDAAAVPEWLDNITDRSELVSSME